MAISAACVPTFAVFAQPLVLSTQRSTRIVLSANRHAKHALPNATSMLKRLTSDICACRPWKQIDFDVLQP
jgi:hypothetical protein